MQKPPRIIGIHAVPSKTLRWILASLPFILIVIVYLIASDIRHQENPQDKLLPTLSQMVQAIDRMAFTQDKRSGNYLMLQDTTSSLKRIFIGVFAASVLGLLIGLNMALFPGLRALTLSGLTFLSMIPPLAILPILFIMVGVDELGKVTLIFLGVFPIIARDTYLSVSKLPQEQITKAFTLGANQLALVYRIVLPQIVPKLLESIRLSLGAAWLFLIAAEAIASSDGLGYRIFLVRRFLSMDVIIPYVLWITFLGYMLDTMLRLSIHYFFPWYQSEK